MSKIIPISVVMPAYNAEKYIREAIDSILQQTFANFEFIIINDGSTDNTKRIVESYDDPRIKLIDNITNQGAIKSINQALLSVGGKYFARMDADDISMPNRLEMQYNFLESNPEISILGSYYVTTADENKIIDPPFVHNKIKIELIKRSPFGHPTIMMRVDNINNNNLQYDETFHYADDYMFWVRAAIKEIKFANIPIPLLKYRIHESQISTAKQIEQQQEANRARHSYVKHISGSKLTDSEINEVITTFKNTPLVESIKIIDKLFKINKESRFFDHSLYNEFLWSFIRGKFGFANLWSLLKSPEYDTDFKFCLLKNKLFN